MITYRLFQGKGTYGFEAQVSQLLFSYQPTGLPVRLVFFDNPSDTEEYYRRWSLLQKKISTGFNYPVPVSYVAQPPCSGKVVMEAHELNGVPEDARIIYKKHYCLVEYESYRFLFVSGINKSEGIVHTASNTAGAFREIRNILATVKMPVSSIVRQWNYIERIGAFDRDGFQNYQNFNNERSIFYARSQWESGYPAATGIGMQYGGVSIDLDAVSASEGKLTIYGLDNPLQVPAHAYSREVLLGKNDRTTPKFERGKVLALRDGKGMIYISGTAAIRGEQSLAKMGVEEQTWVTLENIAALVSRKNLLAAGVDPVTEVSLELLRVYLKRQEDQPSVRNIIEKAYPGLTVLYVVADVCRDELLVEMEGICGRG